MQCRHCGKPQPGETAYCVYCGQRCTEEGQTRRCPSCGAEAAEGTRFCGVCGAPLERRGARRDAHGVPLWLNALAGGLGAVILLLLVILTVGLALGV